MTVEQIYTDCLAQGAYYICSDGEAAIIDPLRDTAAYLERAESDGARITYIFETHFHADFVSGHLELAQSTTAPIVYGPNAAPTFAFRSAHDGETFRIGKVSLTAIHTPGHTLESTCYLLRDENEKPYCIFTGDTLFIGDVGRPDLAQQSDLTANDLASMLYTSLREKIMPLPDDVIIYPAHGAGSACGKNISKETFATIGNQKAFNYALQPQTREAFVAELVTGLDAPPPYFPENVRLNREGYAPLAEVLTRAAVPLSPKDFLATARATKALLLDVRSQHEFVARHVADSIFIGLDGSFAPWVGALVTNLRQPILLIAPVGREAEAATRLARVGYDNTIGYLEGGVAAWAEADFETDHIRQIKSTDFLALPPATATIVDVRKASEYNTAHLPYASNLPLHRITNWASAVSILDRSARPVYLHCAGGYRSVIAASILKARGIHHIVNIEGGWDALTQVVA